MKLRAALATLAALLFALLAGAALPGATRLAGAEELEAHELEPMPAAPTGSIYEKRGRWYVKITIAPKQRRNIALPSCADEPAADARRVILADLAVKLRAADVALDTTERLLTEAGARTGKALAQLLSTAERLCRGEVQVKAPAKKSAPSTFADVGSRWTSGELARDFPDHVKGKKSAERDRQRLAAYVYPLVGDVPIADFTLDHAETVMHALPPKRVRTAATRRHVAQIMHRVLGLAVFPLRLRVANPLPRGFMPKIGKGKAKGWLYPDEDRTLLASPAVPLAWRVLYGFLHREGPRLSEAAALNLADVDLDRGAVKLDENKTDDARAWALSPGVAPALAAWIAHREKVTGARLAPSAPLFVDEKGERVTGEGIDLAKQFRAHLAAAGIDRAELFERTASRVHIRLHDTRATFVTISLANGRSETWVADRTGHRSSTMINKYRRAARTAEELGLGELVRLDLAIPELRAEDDEGDDGEGLDGTDEVSTGSVYQEGSAATSSGSGAWIRTMIRGFKVSTPRAPRPKASKTSAKQGADDDPLPRLARGGDTSTAPVDTSRRALATGRAGLLMQMLDAAGEAAAAGDLEGARIAHDAAGLLLAGREVMPPVKPDPCAHVDVAGALERHRGADVLNLDSARRARGRS